MPAACTQLVGTCLVVVQPCLCLCLWEAFLWEAQATWAPLHASPR